MPQRRDATPPPILGQPSAKVISCRLNGQKGGLKRRLMPVERRVELAEMGGNATLERYGKAFYREYLARARWGNKKAK